MTGHGTQRGDAQFALLAGHVGCVVLADAMLVADGATIVDDRLAGRMLETLPALQRRRIARGRTEHVGGIDARPLAIDMREVGEHMDFLALGGQAVAQAGLDLLQQAVDVAPVGGGLQGVHGVARLPQGLAQVGEAEAVLRPLAPQQGAGEDPAEAFQQGLRLAQRQSVLPAVAGHAEGQHALALARAAQRQVFLQPGDLSGMAGQGQLGHGFHGVGQAQHRQRHARLGQLAGGLQGLLPVRQEDAVEALVLGQRRDPHLHRGNDPEASLRAQHQFAQVRSRRGCREGSDFKRPGEGLQGPAGEKLFDPPVAQRLLATGAAGDPATEGRQLPGLREMPERVAQRTQLALHLRAGGAGAEGRDQALAVQIEQAVHALQRDRQYRPPRGLRIDMAGHGSTAAIGNQLQVAGVGQ
ncbi:hypothetical protein ALP65_04687, partial [Pseudomonas aeruginosa]